MDGENNGKPYLKWMIWGENPLFSETSSCKFQQEVEKLENFVDLKDWKN